MKYLTAVLLLIASFALGQWDPYGLVITHNDLADYDMCTDGKSGAIVVWDYYDGQDLDLKAQHIDSAGYFQWGSDGIMVYEDDDFSQQDINAISDGKGGAFFSWRDFRNREEEAPQIYAQYVDSLGNLKWPAEGIKVFNKTTGQLVHDVILDGQGGIIVVAEDEHDGRHLLIQRIDESGNYVWPDSGIYIFNSTTHWFFEPRLVQVDTENFACVWKYLEYSGSPNDYDIYVQKFSLAGEIAWQENGLPVVEGEYCQKDFKVAPDGAGGITVAWINQDINDYSVYADRIDSSGNSRWQQNGMLLSREDINLWDIWVFNINNDFIFLWCPLVEDTLFSQIIRSNGERVWPEGGKILYLQNKVLRPRDIISGGDLEFQFVTVHDSSYSYHPYIGAKTDTSGTDCWPNRPFLDTYILDNLLEMISDDTGGMIVCWRVMLQYDIRIQRIYSNGRVGGDTTSAIIDPINETTPTRLNLFQNYPNPFNAQTKIDFSINEPYQNSHFSIFDINGRLVKNFDLSRYSLGNNYIIWEGDDKNGLTVASGIYLGVLSDIESSETIKINLIK